MRKLINGSPEDIGRGKLAQRNRRRIVCCIKRFACRAQLALLAFIVCVVAPAGRSSLDRKLFTVPLAQKPATEKSDRTEVLRVDENSRGKLERAGNDGSTDARHERPHSGRVAAGHVGRDRANARHGAGRKNRRSD